MMSPPVCPTCGLEVAKDALACPRDGTNLVANDLLEIQNDPIIGQRLGDYVVTERIGAGGMGIVYKAVQPLIDKTVAIKVLRPDVAQNPLQVQRLLAEARAVNAIRHRGIIDIFGFGRVPGDGRQYVVMEHLQGTSLEQIIRERAPLPAEEVLQLLDEILSALAAAHGAGVIHRDLKPSNIYIVNQKDASRYVKLLDFGLAKQLNAPADSAPQSQVNIVSGTPEYMAPEQCCGEQPIPATDLYAIGVVAFQMLTGRLPFTGSSPLAVAMSQVQQPAPRASSYEASVPSDLDELVYKLMEKEPEKRPSSAQAVRGELAPIRKSLLAGSTRVAFVSPYAQAKPTEEKSVDPAAPTIFEVGPTPSATTEPGTQWDRLKVIGKRYPSWTMGAAAAAAMLLLGAGTAAVLSRKPPPPPVQPVVVAPPAPAPTPTPTPPAGTVAPDPVPEPPARAEEPTALVRPPPPPKKPKPGTLKLRVYGGWANITLDGVALGQMMVLDKELPAGPHRLEAENPARGTYSEKFVIRPGQTLEILAKLQPPNP